MNWSIIFSLVKKDASQIFRHKFIAFVVLLSIVWFAVIYFVLPKQVDETLEVAFYAPALPFEVASEEQGLSLESFSSPDEVREKVEADEYKMGLVLSDDFLVSLQTGGRPKVMVYFSQEVMPELQTGFELLLEEMAYQITGQKLPVEMEAQVLGQDMVGEQIPERDRVRPLFLTFMLLVEMMSLSVLILEEIESGVITAILVTPASLKDLMISKGITGFSLAFLETFILAALVGALGTQVLLILPAIILGAIMVAGIALLVGSVAKDVVSSFAWTMLIFVVFVIPSVAVLMPGEAALWVKAVPSYHLIHVLNQGLNYQASFSQVWVSLLALLLISVIVFYLGYLALKRRYA